MKGAVGMLAPMRTALRLTALGIAIVTLALWVFGGFNLGWTKTSVPIEHVDEITEQEYVEWEKRFIPGIEFLAGGLMAAAAVAGVSFLARKH